MDHVVFFPAHDGSPAFRRVASLEDAVRLVEHLRNSEGVDHVSVHQLVEVPLAFKAYYRVEMPGGDVPPLEAPVVPLLVADAPVPVPEAAPAETPVAELPVVPVQASEEPAEQPAPESAPAPASLGFFAR